MYCALCHSSNGAKFTAEMMIHFSGLKHLDKPAVLVFPEVSICMDCGFSGFTTPESELRILAGCGKTRFEAEAVPRNSLVSTAQPDKKKACVEKTSSSWMCLAT